MSKDGVLGVDFLPPPAPSAGQVNVTADGLTELQRAGLTDEQYEALQRPTVVDPRSPLADEPNAAVPGEPLDDGDMFVADDYTDEHPHSHLGGDDPDGDLAGYDGRIDPVDGERPDDAEPGEQVDAGQPPAEPIEATEGHAATVLDDMGPEPQLDESA